MLGLDYLQHLFQPWCFWIYNFHDHRPIVTYFFNNSLWGSHLYSRSSNKDQGEVHPERCLMPMLGCWPQSPSSPPIFRRPLHLKHTHTHTQPLLFVLLVIHFNWDHRKYEEIYRVLSEAWSTRCTPPFFLNLYTTNPKTSTLRITIFQAWKQPLELTHLNKEHLRAEKLLLLNS